MFLFRRLINLGTFGASFAASRSGVRCAGESGLTSFDY